MAYIFPEIPYFLALTLDWSIFSIFQLIISEGNVPQINLLDTTKSLIGETEENMNELPKSKVMDDQVIARGPGSLRNKGFRRKRGHLILSQIYLLG